MSTKELIKNLKDDNFTVSIEKEDGYSKRIIAYLEEKNISKDKSDFLKGKYSNAVSCVNYPEDGLMHLGFNFISYIH